MDTKLIQNTLWLTLASVGQKVVSFIYFLFLAKVMLPEKTGVYFLSVSLAMIFSVLADFGTTPVAIREIAKNPDQTSSILKNLLCLKIPLLIVGYTSSLIATWLLGYEKEIFSLVAITSFVLVLDSLHLLFYGVLRGHHQLFFESIGMFLGQCVSAILGGLVLWLSPSIPLLVWVLLGGSLLNVVISSSILVRRFGSQVFIPVWNRTNVKRYFYYAIPFALAAIFVKVYSYVDIVLISKFLDASAVGLYGLAYKFTYAFQFIPLAFVASLYPRFSSLIVQKNIELRRTFDRSLWYMLLIGTPLVFGLSLISEHAVLLAGEEYRASAPVLAILAFALFPLFLDFPIGSLLNAAGKQTVKTALMGGTMIMNFLLNLFMIPLFGILGAAYAALISFSGLLLGGCFFIPQIIPSYRFHAFFTYLFLAIISGGLMYASGWMILKIMPWPFVIPLCGLVYLIALFATGLLKKQDVLLLMKLASRRV